MLSWPDELCEARDRGGRHVVRYELCDSGESRTIDPEAPAYRLRDLAADAAALARGLDDRPAHMAGIGVAGMVAQVAALDHPDAFSALTLAATRPVAHGPVAYHLPDHDATLMDRLFSRAIPDRSDSGAVSENAAAAATILGADPGRRKSGRRSHVGSHVQHGACGAVANQLGVVFSKLDCKPRWRERLAELAMPALVVHGRRDPSSLSATAKLSRARSPGRGWSHSTTLPRPYPKQPPTAPRQQCSPCDYSRPSSSHLAGTTWDRTSIGQIRGASPPTRNIHTYAR